MGATLSEIAMSRLYGRRTAESSRPRLGFRSEGEARPRRPGLAPARAARLLFHPLGRPRVRPPWLPLGGPRGARRAAPRPGPGERGFVDCKNTQSGVNHVQPVWCELPGGSACDFRNRRAGLRGDLDQRADRRRPMHRPALRPALRLKRWFGPSWTGANRPDHSASRWMIEPASPARSRLRWKRASRSSP
jgi:hypothetical protein